MKKFIKYTAIAGLVGFLVIVFLFLCLFLSHQWETGFGKYSIYQVSGQSMEDYGLHDGDRKRLDENKECTPGDICVFELQPETCNEKGCFRVGVTDKVLIKFLKSSDNGCYFFTGNNDPDTSFDSRDFGCLNPGQFQLVGVVQ